MRYIDRDFYIVEYLGEDIPAEDFARYAKRAEEAIDIVTNYRLIDKDFETLTDNLKKLVRLAVAYQIEYLAIVGLDSATTSEVLTNFTVGKVSVSTNKSNSNNSLICKKALNILESAGLLYNGVGVC